MARAARGRGLGGPLGISAVLHVGAVVALALHRAGAPASMPPTYSVELVAAPPGPRAQGVVTEQAPPATEPRAAPPPRAETAPTKVAPIPNAKTPPRRDPAPPATPSPPGTKPADQPAQRAGGGETGGRGTDVANVRTEGIAFPFPGYLQNIVRQVALCFTPPRGTQALRADVAFLVRRDGSVADIRMVTPSGNFRFDNEARGAVECAGDRLGALPSGFRDDVLPIVFSFDPTLLR